MLVCHCTAVYEGEVREAIADGARDAFEVADACEAGTVCGSCVPTICSLLAEARPSVRGGALPRRVLSLGSRA